MTARFSSAQVFGLVLAAACAACSRGGGSAGPTRASAPSLQLKAPLAGSLWLEEAPALVSWKARNLEGHQVSVETSRDGGSTWQVAATVGIDQVRGAFAWIPAGPRGEQLVRVSAADGSVASAGHRVELVPALTEVSMGSTLAFALRADGTVRMWGRTPERFYEAYGPDPPLPIPQVYVPAPTVFPGIERIRSLAPMGPHSNQLLALTEDDRVIQWGDYARDLPPILTPTEVPGLSDVLFCRAGSWMSFARLRDGRVFAWGQNQAGTLGDGTDEIRPEPVHIPALDGVVDIAVGWIHCLALKPDGTVLAWGQNAHGTLGDGTYGLFYRTTPEPVPGIVGAVAIVAGYDHSAALLADGSVWSWGDNGWGQLGRETADFFDPFPGQVEGLPTDIVEIHGNGDEGYALTSLGTLYTWGLNGQGQLGLGEPSENSIFLPLVATAVPPLRTLFAGAGAAPHAITIDGTWIAWGSNLFGWGVGDGTGVNRFAPVPIVVR